MLQELISPAEWNKELARLASQPRSLTIFVCGPKSSGKSTFSKLLANRLMTEETRSESGSSQGVAFLDLDPGQPEFSPPGVISLVHLKAPNLSPGFCHPLLHTSDNKMLRAHAIASITPATSPEHYLECVLDLYGMYRSTFHGKRQCPLVINTPGWIQGTGLDILTELITAIRPSDVVYMSNYGPAETVDALMSVAKKNTLVTLPSQANEYTSRTASHLRAMQTMSYLHLDLDSAKGGPLAWNPLPLTTISPWRVRYSGPRRGIFGIMCYDWQPATNLLAESLNGAVVAVVEVAEPAAFRDMADKGLQDDDSASADGQMDEDKQPAQDEYSVATFAPLERHLITWSVASLPFIQNPDGRTLDPAHSRVLGLALIRGIDASRRELQVLSPIAPETMNDIGQNGKGIVLVAGSFDTPSWAYTEDLHYQSANKDGDSENDEEEAGLEITDEDTDDDASDRDEETKASPNQATEVPWVEVLRGGQKRAVGSKVWRVRRDLGRGRP